MELLKSLFSTDGTVTAAEIALIGAIFSVLFSSAISLAVAKRTTYITAVTAERSKWIDSLRENIAKLLSVCGIVFRGNNSELAEADRLVSLISMQMNPAGKIDKNMLELLLLLPALADKKDMRFRQLEAAFVQHAQFLFKAEWERIKYEAMGVWSRPVWWLRAILRAHAYKQFCKKDVLAKAFATTPAAPTPPIPAP